MVGDTISQSYEKGSQRLAVVSEVEEDDDSEGENHTELFLETLAKEQEERVSSDHSSPIAGAGSGGLDSSLDVSPVSVDSVKKGAWAVISTPIPPSPAFLNHSEYPCGGDFPPLSDYVVWPALPRVVELEEGSNEDGGVTSEYTVESPTGSPIQQYAAPETDAPAPRNQYQRLARVDELAAGRLKKRNLEGTDVPAFNNKFSVLSNSAIMLRASLMGVQIPDDNFATIDVLRELEKSRQLLHEINSEKNSSNLSVSDGLGNSIPLSLTWDEDGKDDIDSFTLVQMRQSKKKASRKKNVVISSPSTSTRPLTRSQKKDMDGRAALNPSRPTRAREKPGRYK